MQSGKNLVLAATNQRLHMLKTKLLDPNPVCHDVAHLIVKHRQRDRGILDQNSQLSLEIIVLMR